MACFSAGHCVNSSKPYRYTWGCKLIPDPLAPCSFSHMPLSWHSAPLTASPRPSFQPNHWSTKHPLLWIRAILMFQHTPWNRRVFLNCLVKQVEATTWQSTVKREMSMSLCWYSHWQRCLTSHTGTLCVALNTTCIQQLLLKTSFHGEQLTTHINIEGKVQSLGKNFLKKKNQSKNQKTTTTQTASTESNLCSSCLL